MSPLEFLEKNLQKKEKPESESSKPEFLKYVPRAQKVLKPTEPRAPRQASVFRVAVVPDAHVPRHEKKCWPTFLGLLREFQPHAVVIIGDFGDFESLSHHPKNRPDITKFAAECYEANIALDAVQASAPNAEFYYVEGNHEYRAVKYVNAFPHLDGLLSVPENLFILPFGTHEAIPSLLKSRNRPVNRVHVDLRGMTWIPFRENLHRAWRSPWGAGYQHSAKANSSGWAGGANHAAYHANTVGPVTGCKTIVYGHNHTFAFHRSAAEYEAWCCGSLVDMDDPSFDYKGGPVPWVNGVLLQEFHGDLVNTTPVHIEKGKALFRDKIFG